MILASLLLAAQLSAATPAPAMPGVNVPAIKVNTVGYPPSWRKIAMLNFKPEKPALVDEAGKRVYEISVENVRACGVDDASKDEVWQAEFSDFKTPGQYRLVNGKERSDSFRIGEGLYEKASQAALKMFYYQRCGVALGEPMSLWDADDDPQGYSRSGACHHDLKKVFDLNRHPDQILVKGAPYGGWHDAGNHDMYVPSTAPTTMILINAALRGPAMASPILTEAEVGLSWVRRMMLPDGSARARLGVYRQGDLPAGSAVNDKAARWLSGPTTAATAKACALFALSARAFISAKDDNAVWARNAWNFLKAHPGRIFADNHGSDQPLWDDDAEHPEISQRALAAAEMWVSFKDKSALAYLQKVWADKELMPSVFDRGAWSNLGRLVMSRAAFDPSFPPEMREEAKKRILDCVDQWKSQTLQKDGYRSVTFATDYYWSSNSNVMEKALMLLDAARLDPEGHAWAKEAARDQWHWMLGRNPNGYSMVTRVGHGPDRMYHLEWGKKKTPPPGYMIGGPNSVNGGFLAPGAPAKALLWDNPAPMKSSRLPAHAMWHNEEEDLWEGGFIKPYTWDAGWWVVNEPDIYNNANLVAVAVEMQN